MEFSRILLTSLQFTLFTVWKKSKHASKQKKRTLQEIPIIQQLYLCCHLFPKTVHSWWTTSVYFALFLQCFCSNLTVLWEGFFWRLWMILRVGNFPWESFYVSWTIYRSVQVFWVSFYIGVCVHNYDYCFYFFLSLSFFFPLDFRL